MKNPDLELETKVIERFISKNKRDRYLSFIKKAKTRHKFISDLSHIGFLEKDLFDKVDKNEHAEIKERIKKLGVLKDCYVISENDKIDGKRLDIVTALSKAIGADMGTLLVFGDAEMVYAEAEGFNNRWISRK